MRAAMKKADLVFLGAAMACLAGAMPAHAAPEAPGIMGVIKDGSGKVLEGVAVSARSSSQTMTTSVYTDARGVYVFPHLAAGTYKLWAQAVGFATGRADVTLDGAHTASDNLTLRPLADFGPQLT